MIDFPNAKINIGLHITEKRPDNYHNIETFMYPVLWQDALEIVKSSDNQCIISGLDIPPDGKENLCQRAYQLLKQDFDLDSVHIYLHKVIPTGAGLGGGSADAAFTLNILNKIFDLRLSYSQLEAYARKLGSDCAFFIQNRPQYCFQKGDEFTNLALSLKDKWAVLVYPNLAISSQIAYRQVKPNATRAPLSELLLQSNFKDWAKLIQNDFELALFPQYPVLASVKSKLYELGAVYASMSGSGSTLFGIFEKAIEAKKYFPANYQIWEGYLK
jgi:4-diphosphocytidyl-2-C-methyl-D-erythritol kinase